MAKTTSITFCAPEKIPQWQQSDEFQLLLFDTKQLKEKSARNAYTFVEWSDLTPEYIRSIERKLKRHTPIGLPAIIMIDHQGQRLPEFLDGRHRTAYLTGMGARCVPAVVECQDVAEILAMGLARELTPHELFHFRHSRSVDAVSDDMARISM